MKKLTASLVLFIALAVVVHAADGVAVFRTGLQAFQANGAEALVRTWYLPDDVATVEGLKARLNKATADLGDVVDTEVFAPKNLGQHVQRLYGVIYFRKHPLWLRAEYYSIEGRSGFISLEFSLRSDDILPLEVGLADR